MAEDRRWRDFSREMGASDHEHDREPGREGGWSRDHRGREGNREDYGRREQWGGARGSWGQGERYDSGPRRGGGAFQGEYGSGRGGDWNQANRGYFDQDERSGSAYRRGEPYGRGEDWRGGGFERADEGRYASRGYNSRSDYDRQGGSDRGMWDRASDEVASWFGDRDAEQRRAGDQMQAQSHRGRGPKNYTRSDERIREDVCDRLSEDPMVDASEIDVSVENCEVTLTGTVKSRDERRRAEDCAERVMGVRHVQNNTRVQAGDQLPGRPGGGVGNAQGTNTAAGFTPNTERK